MISLIIPSHNNLRHLKNCYSSIRKHAPKVEIVLIDDASTDGTYEWLRDIYVQDPNVVILKSNERKGHTFHYDWGISQATGDIVGIMHADMIMGPNYLNNLIKHLKPKTVVAGTRVEPPLHPPGKEKIIQNFGLDFDDLNIPAFEEFCLKQQQIDKDQTSRGMFAPWIIYKEDFLKMGGHDQIYAPFPYEDSDIFERWILSEYQLIQSRDALVYHLTCRGHRWTDQVGQDDDYYMKVSQRAAREYLRKWGSWIQNDEFQHPIIKPKYNIGYIIEGKMNLNSVAMLEPLCDNLYIEDTKLIEEYIKLEQPNTYFDLSKRIRSIEYEHKDNGVFVRFDYSKITNEDAHALQHLPFIIKDSGQIGHMELGNLKLTIVSMKSYEKDMIQPINRFDRN